MSGNKKYKVIVQTLGLLAATCWAGAASAQALKYDLNIEADFRATTETGCVPVTVVVQQDRWLLRELKWRHRDSMDDLQASGELTRNDDSWSWVLPKTGGTLRYCLTVDDRQGERYVARHTDNWVLMRGDDLFPAVRARSLKGARSETRLRFLLPEKWTSATRYPRGDRDHSYVVSDANRSLDRPTGWLALGRLGVRRDRVAGVRVVVAAPVQQGVRRMDLMALATYAVPEFTRWFSEVPDRLLIVSARDEMWRGALSGPGSLYLHADRPLVSENATSPVLHELVHVAMQRRAVADQDWIDEGLAEYLGLLMLFESGGITRERFRDALEWQAEWAKEADQLGGRRSSGPQTARAVGVFAALHQELGNKFFREWVRRVSASGPDLTLARLRDIAEDVHDAPVKSLPKGSG